MGTTACPGLLVAMDADLGLRRVGRCFSPKRTLDTSADVASEAAATETLR